MSMGPRMSPDVASRILAAILLASKNGGFNRVYYPLKTGICTQCLHPVAILNSTARGTGPDWDASKLE